MNIREKKGNTQIRNIRSLIKKSSSVEKTIKRTYISDNSSNNEEVSFDITPEEEEINKAMKAIENEANNDTMTTIQSTMTFGQTNKANIQASNTSSAAARLSPYNTGTDNLIDESNKILIELDKIPNTISIDEIEEKPYDSSGISKIINESSSHMICNTMPSNTSLPSSLPGKNGSNSNNINSALNNRLFEKIKQIKTLERELKDKKEVIERQKKTIEKQSIEIKRLNAEKNPKYKTEVVNISKQLKEKEDELVEKKHVMDNLIEQYKEKMNNLISANEISLEKITRLEAKNKELKEKEVEHLKQITNLQAKANSIEKKMSKEQLSSENDKNEKNKMEVQILEYKSAMQKVLSGLIKMKGEHKSNKEYLNKIRILFSDIEDDQTIQINETEPNSEL